MTIATRLAQLQAIMQQNGTQALIVPSSDPHMSEYLPKYWQGRAWLSGFTGSAGTLVVLTDNAYLWADSRYWLQAEKQLAGTGIVLKKIGQDPTISDFLLDTLGRGAKISVDAAVLSLDEFDALAKDFEVNGRDLLGDVWQDRPALPTAPIYVHDDQFIGQSASEKLELVRAKMEELGADYHLIATLDDIAWLTNLRGADVDCNPVFLAYLLIGCNESILYVNGQKLSQEVQQKLKDANIVSRDYHALGADLAQLTGTLLIDPKNIAKAAIDHLTDKTSLVKATNPSTFLKAQKSTKELEHIRQAMVQDGVALCQFFAELEQKLAQGEYLDEVMIDTLLIEARKRQPYFVSPSFESIVGFAGNGAIVHYRAGSDCATLDGNGLLLIDSGAQYQNGTTDITRMVGVGQVCDEAKRDVTMVLKAHIALAQAVFPDKVSSVVIDAIARLPLWQEGLDYGHGTGHGVGYFLNVHEPTQVIAYSCDTDCERILTLGMVTSNEPGLYRGGKWGVRIENLLACVPYKDSEFGKFLQFETLTLCPIDTRIILPHLLDDNELDWLNSYHKTVRDKLLPLLDGQAKAWLLARTEPLDV